MGISNQNPMTAFWKISLILIFILLFTASTLRAQKVDFSNDTITVEAIYNHTLTEGKCYQWLEYLCTKIGARLSGTPAYLAAAEYTRQVLDTLGLDSVWLQPVIVPHWDRGEKEIARVVHSGRGTYDLRVLALGSSVATGEKGIQGEIIEILSNEQLQKLGEKGIKGKIVFFNRPMERGIVRTMSAYGRAVDQRYSMPTEAAKLGAIGAIVRSMTTKIDTFPHTGGTQFLPEGPNIPAFGVCTQDAETLSDLLKSGPVSVYMRSTSKMLSEKPSYNVIGEIRGSEFPQEIIVIGGHLDSWDIGQGAHDDGTGCVQSMQVLYTLKSMGYKPKRTIRCVLFSNEENGLRGGTEYAAQAKSKGEKHIAALESDSGGFTPRGFNFEGHPDIFVEKFKKTAPFVDILAPYGLSFNPGGSGADISPLKEQKTLLIGFQPDLHRYFDYHHAETDVFSAVNQRELEMGAASMTALIFLIDKYGL